MNQRKCCSTLRYGIVAFCIMMSIMCLSGTAWAATGVNVNSHTEAQIRQYILEHNVVMNGTTTFAEDPSTTAPYAPGKVSDETLNSALATMNAIRYIAGLDAVTLDDSYTEMVQAGALVNAVNRVLTHSPEKPIGMEDDLYNLGYRGASSANIASGYSNLNSALINGWMYDGNASNIDRLGHRRWIINPTMKKTGFGIVDRYSAMYSFDVSNRTAAQSGVIWPSQVMPAEYFGRNYPWSYSAGRTLNTSSVSVKLVRESDQKTWNFSSSDADGYFNVNNDGYGQSGCVIFRPTDLGKYVGETFHVTINSGGSVLADYSVEFFSLVPVTDFQISYSTIDGKIDRRYQIRAGSVVPQNAFTEYIWESGDEQVAIVENIDNYDGNIGYADIVFKSCGETTIKVTSTNGGVVKECKVSVPHTPGDEATCESDQICTVCGEVITPALGHEWGEWTNADDQMHQRVCQHDAKHVEAEQHEWNEGEVTTAPDCEHTGVKTYTCIVCGTTREESIDKLGHKYGSWKGLDLENHVRICANDETHVDKAEHTWDEGKVIREPQCEETGKMQYICTECRLIKKTDIPPLEHEWGEWTADSEDDSKHIRVCGHDANHVEEEKHIQDDGVITKQPTCLDKGEMTYTCTVCGAQWTDEIPELGHEWGKWTDVDDQMHQRVCQHDAKHVEEEQHEWNEGEVTTAPDCEHTGVKTYTCTSCSATKTEVIDALGHDFGTWTYLNERMHTRRCSHDLDGEHIRKESHNFGTATVVKEPTCTENGSKMYSCSVCGGTKYEDIPAIEHEWGRWTVDSEDDSKHMRVCAHDESHVEKEEHHHKEDKVTNPPSCLEKGEKEYTCTVCGKTYKEEMEALGHQWDNGIITKQPTCEDNGERLYTCISCEVTKTEVVNALGHDFGAWTYVDEKTHGQFCSHDVNGEHALLAEHSFDDGVIEKNSTSTENGIKVYTCSVCRGQYRELLPLQEDYTRTDAAEMTPVISASMMEAQIIGTMGDQDAQVSGFGLLQAKGTATSSKSVRVSWKHVPGAYRYVVYGNKCGRANHYKKIEELTGTGFVQKKLKKGTYYKYLVVAVDGSDRVVALSKTIHVATKGGKVGNPKKVNVNKSTVTLKKGKTTKIKAKVAAQSSSMKVKKHRAIAYESSNANIATVTKKGVIKAKAKGTCFVYAYAQNGVCKKIRVRVK